MKKKSSKSTTSPKGRHKSLARKSGTKQLARHKRLSGRQIVEYIIEYFSRHPREVVNYKSVAAGLGFTTMPEKQLIVRTLESLVEQGVLTQVEVGRYRYQAGGELVEGIFESRRNYSVVVPEGEGTEIIISERNNPEHALDGDRVRVALFPLKAHRTRTGQVVEILHRRRSAYVGRVVEAQGFSYLHTEDRALNSRILLPKEALGGARNNDKAIVRITHWGARDPEPTGEVVEVLGKAGHNDTEMHAILAEYDLSYRYPEEAEAAARAIPEEIPQEEIGRREDFRPVTTFTIDPQDAKDFDDALSWRRLDDGLLEVGVHIADVSYYVTPGGVIDKEAYERATSVYLVDRTIPMLPERLCNDLCSLRPEVDRLAFSCIFTLNDRAEVQSHRIGRTIIRSDKRYSYEEAQAVIDTQEGDLAEEILSLHALAQQLRSRRFAQGAIDFTTQEVQFVLDAEGRPVDVSPRSHGTAHELIEEFMLLANRTVATEFGKNQRNGKGEAKTFIYRIHDLPDSDKLNQMGTFIRRFGYQFKSAGDAATISKNLNAVISASQGKPEATLIQTIAVRTMARAEYSTDNIGHYGLSFDYYTHFTSPIRRYPDLMVHRLIARYSGGEGSVSQVEYEAYARHCSEQEQVASKAERDSIRYKQVEYMSTRLGKVFDAVISGVTEWGIYVELTHSHCEGLVPMRLLDDDYYDFDEKNYTLLGRRYRRKFTLGDAVRVRAIHSDFERRQIDFELVD